MYKTRRVGEAAALMALGHEVTGTSREGTSVYFELSLDPDNEVHKKHLDDVSSGALFSGFLGEYRKSVGKLKGILRSLGVQVGGHNE